MRISDWSSDVCSSDLFGHLGVAGPLALAVDLLVVEGLQWAELGVAGAGVERPAVRRAVQVDDVARMGRLDHRGARSEESRVGNAWGRTCRSRGSPCT